MHATVAVSSSLGSASAVFIFEQCLEKPEGLTAAHGLACAGC